MRAGGGAARGASCKEEGAMTLQLDPGGAMGKVPQERHDRNDHRFEIPSSPQRLAKEVGKWSPKDVAQWACQSGFIEHSDALLKHQIDGEILPMLGESALREIGFTKVGTRLEFQKAITEIKRGV